MSRRLSGWQKQHGRNWSRGQAAMTLTLEAAAWQPAKWDVFLQALALDDETALQAARKGDRRIRAWVDRHYSKHFVPCSVLHAMGISEAMYG